MSWLKSCLKRRIIILRNVFDYYVRYGQTEGIQNLDLSINAVPCRSFNRSYPIARTAIWCDVGWSAIKLGYYIFFVFMNNHMRFNNGDMNFRYNM